MEVHATIELSFKTVSGVTLDIHVLDGVYVPQVEGVNFGVVCPIGPMVSMSCVVMQFTSAKIIEFYLRIQMLPAKL